MLFHDGAERLNKIIEGKIIAVNALGNESSLQVHIFFEAFLFPNLQLLLHICAPFADQKILLDEVEPLVLRFLVLGQAYIVEIED